MRVPGGTTVGAAGHADPVIRALRLAAAQLDDDGETWLADYLREAADQVRCLVRSMSGDEVAGLMEELRRVARRNSGVFLGSALAAGLSLGRRLRVRNVDGPEPAAPARAPAGGRRPAGIAARD